MLPSQLSMNRNRATFGQNVGPFRKQVGNGVEFYFEGMSPKSVAAVPSASSTTSTVSVPSSLPAVVEIPGSPILKAQLCAPPKLNRKEAPKQASHTFVIVHRSNR